MTTHHDAAGHPPAEADRIDSRTILLIGFGSLAIFVVAGIAATTWLEHRLAASPAPAIPAELGRSKLGLVEQALFDQSTRGATDREARKAWLESTGWVDERAGVVHIPIARAMELVAKGARVPPSTPPSSPPFGPGPEPRGKVP